MSIYTTDVLLPLNHSLSPHKHTTQQDKPFIKQPKLQNYSFLPIFAYRYFNQNRL